MRRDDRPRWDDRQLMALVVEVLDDEDPVLGDGDPVLDDEGLLGSSASAGRPAEISLADVVAAGEAAYCWLDVVVTLRNVVRHQGADVESRPPTSPATGWAAPQPDRRRPRSGDHRAGVPEEGRRPVGAPDPEEPGGPSDHPGAPAPTPAERRPAIRTWTSSSPPHTPAPRPAGHHSASTHTLTPALGRSIQRHGWLPSQDRQPHGGRGYVLPVDVGIAGCHQVEQVEPPPEQVREVHHAQLLRHPLAQQLTATLGETP